MKIDSDKNGHGYTNEELKRARERGDLPKMDLPNWMKKGAE